MITGIIQAGKFPGLTLKAWAKINGTTGAILASFGIASVTRTIAGRYVVVFASAMANSNYLVDGTCNGAAGYSDLKLMYENGSQATTQIALLAKSSDGTGQVDAQGIYIAIYE